MNWDIQEVKSKTLELSSPNPEVEAIVHLLEDGVSDLQLISQKVRLDPILSARLLQLANSSFYGFPREVKDVEMACVILGANTVRNLIYTLVVLARFNHSKPKTGLDYTRIWHHSLMTACFSQAMSKHLKLDVQVGFTAGLFNNLGLVLMDCLYPDKIKQSMEIALKEHRNLLEVEEAVMGRNHQTLTAVVLELWAFPETIIKSITGSAESESLPALVVSLANILATGTTGQVVPGIPIFQTMPLPTEPSGADLTVLPGMILEAHHLYHELADTFFPKTSDVQA